MHSGDNLAPSPYRSFGVRPEELECCGGLFNASGLGQHANSIDESTVRYDQGIIASCAKQGLLSLALSNRGKEPYAFLISGIAETNSGLPI